MAYISMWIKSLIITVMVMVMVGGATRLTHSGLSIVEWKPLSVLPPLNTKQWQEEFDAYQQTPEYKKVNYDMELKDFKNIYWLEYFHRLLGKLIGLLVVVPFCIFFKSMPLWLRWRMVFVFTLGALQGVIGWWMVKSGLIQDPTVSHLRLSTHLLIAFGLLALLSYTLWQVQGKSIQSIMVRDFFLLVFLIATILYGALVAGLKAGLIYNTFPLMEGQWIPSEWNFYNPFWKNFFNNAALVQWIHRFLALSTAAYTYILWIRYCVTYRLLGIKLTIQVILGIVTLIWGVPLSIALIHQGWAMIVWIVALKTTCLSKKQDLMLEVKSA